ncbi:MAG: SAM-dependent methyltransferase, partial [Myxococcales bacterium]
MAGTLYLIPSSLGPAETGDIVPAGVQARVRALRYFIVEHPRT